MSALRPPWRLLCYVALPALLLSICHATPALAQPAVPLRIKPMFGVDTTEFFKGAWVKLKPGNKDSSYAWISTNMGQLWTVMDRLRMSVIRFQLDETPDIVTSLATGRTSVNHRLMTSVAFANTQDTAFDHASVGREVIFYPFNTANVSLDSVQFPQWKCKFTTVQGGFVQTNTSEVGHGNTPATEQHYKLDSMASGTVIAEGIAFDWIPTHVSRWPRYFDGTWKDAGDTVIDSYRMFGGHSWHVISKATTHYVTVTGHLFNDLDANQSANVLRIELFHEVPQGSYYFTDASTSNPSRRVAASSNIRRPLDTLYVTRGQLWPDTSGLPNWNRYREISLPFDMRLTRWGIPGPMYSDALGGTESQRIDMKITWLGKDVAIRSIALRDSIGELVLGTSAAGEAYRTRALTVAKFSYDNSPNDTVYRWPIIARIPHLEQQPVHMNAYNRIHKLLRENITGYDSINQRFDRLPTWTEIAWPAEMHTRHDDTNANANVVVAEHAFAEHWRLTRWGAVPPGKLPHGSEIPSIARHNGGRWSLPELTLDAFDIEHRYETNLQFNGFRMHTPAKLPVSYEWSVHHIGRGAIVARDQGRRLIVVPFCVGGVYLNGIGHDHPGRDSMVVHHFPEPAEMRVMANMALCYGARGLMWQQLQAHYNFFKDPVSDSKGDYLWGQNQDFGVMGPFTSDTTQDVYNPFVFQSPGTGGLYGEEGGYYRDPLHTVTFDNFYTGWKTRYQAIRNIHTWVDQVWPYLAPLRWRDSYSIHFTDTVPRFPYNISPITFRPIASGEIVSSIRTHKPGSSTLDSLHRTFVELGIFYKKNTTTNPLLDTNHIFLVNRRCFERTSDIAAASDTGLLMDALAETRTLEVKLNMTHPIDTSTVYGQYTYLRIQELAPDTDTLPLASARRRGLDTVVHPDSLFSITLGPGRAALLRITYAPPDSSIIKGSLEYNNQRKIVWDGESRYHSTYYRWDSTLNDFHVYYRRSIPVSSTVPLGSILWEPIERCVSCVLTSNDSVNSGLIYKNRYPSITVTRRQISTIDNSWETVASIVWQRRTDPILYVPGKQEVMIRDFGFALSGEIIYPPGPFSSRMRRVDLFSGLSDSSGTPVICSGPGGDFISWSDDSLGIVARLRRRDQPFTWWSESAYPLRSLSLSERDLLSYPLPYALSRFPTVPSHTHFMRKDSTTGIAWQQQMTNAQDPPSAYTYTIQYVRLEHIPDSDTTDGRQDTLWHSTEEDPYELVPYARHFHPSIDIVQDSTTFDSQQTIREAVTWETVTYQHTPPTPQPYRTAVNFQSIFTSTATGTIFTVNPLVVQQIGATFAETFVWPNIASLNNRYLEPAFQDSARFAIVYQSYALLKHDILTHTQINYRHANYRNGWARPYSYEGFQPSGSASRLDQDHRYASLYKRIGPGPGGATADTALRTSRQFLAKARPGGYVAEGRDLHLRLDDSLGTSLSATLHDVWFADADEAKGLRLAERSDVMIDTLDAARELFRTEYFRTSDSAWMGWQTWGAFVGDSAWGGDARLSLVVELVDSASGGVVRMLDSFDISAAEPSQYRSTDSVFDLLLGTYYIRMRIDTAGFVVPASKYGGRYPVAERAEYVEAPSYSKLVRRIGTGGAEARIAAEPNPFNGATDVLFSINRDGFVNLTVYDQRGREVAKLLANEWMEQGRYEVPFEKIDLEPGTYLIELRSGNVRVVTKIVRIR